RGLRRRTKLSESITLCRFVCFERSGSEVQILSPRPQTALSFQTSAFSPQPQPGFGDTVTTSSHRLQCCVTFAAGVRSNSCMQQKLSSLAEVLLARALPIT